MPEKTQKRYRITVSGRVQGVNFRYYTIRKANKLGLVGYARNTEDGKVEVVAQGQEENLKKLLDFCKKGPWLARVDNVDVKEEKIGNEFDGFGVRY